MNRYHYCICLVLGFLTLLASTATTWAEEQEVIRTPMWSGQDHFQDDDLPSVTSIMVTLKPHARTYAIHHYDLGNGKTEDLREETLISTNEAQKLSKAAGIELKPISVSSFQLLGLPHPMTPREARVICAKLLKHPDVKYADPSTPVFGFRVPNDPLYSSSQWNFQQSAGGVNLPPAWDTDIGGTNIVVAVLDSGILPNHRISQHLFHASPPPQNVHQGVKK